MTTKVAVNAKDIQRFNSLTDALAGTPNYNMFYVYHQYRNVKTWCNLGWGKIIEHLYGEYYLKRVKDTWYLMWEYRGDAERWELSSDVAKAYFGVW